MITKFGCKNIKAIRNFTMIDIKPITVIMGENSSGKSSILQALSLLSVNKIYGNDIRKISYNNPFSNFEDNDTFKNKGENVTLFFEIIEDEEVYSITLIYEDDIDNNQYGLLSKIEIESKEFKLFFTKVTSDEFDINLSTIEFKTQQAKENYMWIKDISSTDLLRTNLKVLTSHVFDSSYTYNEDTQMKFLKFDIKPFLKPLELLSNNLEAIRHIGMIKNVNAPYAYPSDYIGYFGEKYKDIAKNLSSKLYINKSIKNIFNYEIKKIDKDTGDFYLTDSKIKKNLTLNMFGSSVSSTMPILTQYARNREKDLKYKYRLTIIEEPEINEHPLSQARLVEALFPKSRPKKHFNIIETHSEHIVNKLRYLVYTKQLKASDIVIYYKTKDKDEFQKIEIDKKGLFQGKDNNRFPKGFYDATLEEIFEIETANI